MEYLKTILYGIIEGITEWLPISSTGHLILAEKLLDMPYSDEFMSMFRVVIQLGAILAVVLLYFPKLWPFCTDPAKKFVKKDTWTLWFKILVATLPALVLGLLFDDWLDAHLYNYITVAVMLILYGVLFLVVENRRRTPTVTDLSQLSYKQALVIGFWQVLAMIPGTSRSGATIVGPFAWGQPAGGHRVHLFPGDSGNVWRQPSESGEIPGSWPDLYRRRSNCAGSGLCDCIFGERGRHQIPGGICKKARLQTVRLVPHCAGNSGSGGGAAGLLIKSDKNSGKNGPGTEPGGERGMKTWKNHWCITPTCGRAPA